MNEREFYDECNAYLSEFVVQDDDFVYNLSDFPPLSKLSTENKVKFEETLAGKRVKIKGATRPPQTNLGAHVTTTTTDPAPLGPGLHSFKQRSDNADNHVLKTYVKRVYGDEDPPRPSRYIKLNGQDKSDAESRIDQRDNCKDRENESRNENTIEASKRQRRKQSFWGGISSFTNSPNCETIQEAQVKVCDWFQDEDSDEEEDEGHEEEAINELKAQMMREPRGLKNMKRGRQQKGDLKDWSIEGRDVIRKKAFKLVECDQKRGEAKLVELSPSKQIWGLAKMYHEQSGQHSNEAQVILFDPGNLSQSLMGVRTLRRFERQLGQKIKLKPYTRTVKGAGGAQINLLGQTTAHLSIELPGFSRKIKFQPIICSSKEMTHINIALKALKEHETCLHMMKKHTLLEDVHTKEKVSLFGREDLMEFGANVNSVEIIAMVNQLKRARPDSLEAGDLIDLTILEEKIKSNLNNTEVLVEKKKSGYEQVGSLKEAWDVAEADEESVEREYPGNLKADIRKARAMKSGHRVQPLRVMKDTPVDRNTHSYIPCKAQVQFGKDYIINPCPSTVLEAGGLLVTPSLGTMKNPQSLAYVSIINVTDEAIKLKRGDTIGYLEILDEEEDEVICATEEMREQQEEDWKKANGHAESESQGKEMYRKEWPPEGEAERNPKEYPHSGFILLNEEGKATEYLNAPTSDHKKKESAKQDFWRPKLPRVSQHELNKAEKEMWRDFKAPPQNIDPKLGQKTLFKKSKTNDKLELKKAEEEIKVGDKGLFAHGQIYPNLTTLNRSLISAQEREEVEREAKKRYLKDLPKEELEKFIEREIKLDSNAYLRECPSLKGMVKQLFVENIAALTPTIDDPDFIYDPGFCSEIVYHPELKPEFRDKIFSAPIKRLAPDDDEELGRILRSWVRSGILRKQSIDDPKNRSEHSHRIVLVRKKVDGGPPGCRPKPRRITLDLRDLNACSYTHKHHLSSVQDHLSNLEKGGIYCAWDLDNFYSSIPCSEYGSRLLSFSTFSHGSFSYKRLAQGWSSAPGAAGALGARLCSVLDPGTLHLFVDDGLQIGRKGWVSKAKFETLSELGNIDTLISENPATPFGEKSIGEFFHKSQTGEIWSERRGATERGKGADVPSQLGLATREQNPRGGKFKHPQNPQNPKSPKYKSTIPLSGETHSPEDRSGLDMTAEIKEWVYVHENVDLLIKMRDFLKAVIRFNLRVSPRKVRAYATSLPYLGYQLSPDGIQMQSGYLDTILKYKVPRTKAQAKSFVGLIQYFSSITPHLARYTAPLYEALKRKEVNGNWALTECEVQSFHKCKVAFLRSDGVGYIELGALEERPLRLWCDWSTLSVGNFLSQVQRRANGQWGEVLLACTGKKNSKVLAESGSCLGEMYALALGLAKYRPMLLLSLFEVFSDFLSLKYLHTFSRLKGVHYRLFQNMSDYVFRIFTVKSAQNFVADLISRADNIQITSEEMEILGLHESGTLAIADEKEIFKNHWKTFTEGGPSNLDLQNEAMQHETHSEIHGCLQQEIQNIKSEEILTRAAANPTRGGGEGREERRNVRQSLGGTTSLQQKPSQPVWTADEMVGFYNPYKNTPLRQPFSVRPGPSFCSTDKSKICGAALRMPSEETRRRRPVPVSRPAVFCGTQEREINAAVTMRKFNGTSTKQPHHPHDLEEIGHMTIGEMGKRSVGNLSFEGGRGQEGSRGEGVVESKANFHQHINACTQFEGLWNQGTVIQSPEMLAGDKELTMEKTWNWHENLHSITYECAPAYICVQKSQTGKCKHLQLKFPYLSKTEDIFYAASCLPTQNRAIVKQVFDQESDIFTPVYREELIKFQSEDRLLTKVRYFLNHGWPELSEIKQMYPTKGLLEYFYNRHHLKITPDNLIIMTRASYEHCLEERSCIPYSLIYHVFKFSHYGLSEFHASIEQTYQALSYRYFIPELTKFLRFYISRCTDCLQSRLPKPKWSLRMTEARPQISGKIGAFNQCVFTDLSGRLPESQPLKYRYFLVIICKFSGYIETCPLRTMEASEVAAAFHQIWLARFGMPAKCISDVGSCYTGEIFRKVFKQLNIEQRYTNTSIPRGEYAEVSVRQVKLKLKGSLCGMSDHTDWPTALSYAVLAINSSVSPTHLFSPSEIALGSAPNLHLNLISTPGPGWEGNKMAKVGGNSNANCKQTTTLETAKLERGRLRYPHLHPTVAAHSQEMDILRLRKSDPIRIMYSNEEGGSTERNIFSDYILSAALSEMIVENKIVAYARSVPTFSKASNPLFPLKPEDEGKILFRYNPIRRSEKKTAGSLYGSWEGPYRLTYVCNEIAGILEGVRNGRAVAYRTPIDHMRVYYDLNLAEIPGAGTQSTEHQEKGEKHSDNEEEDNNEEENNKEEEDDSSDSDEETVNLAQLDLKRVTPRTNQDLPKVKDVKTLQRYKLFSPEPLLESLLNLPASELILIEPRMEMLLQGLNLEERISRLEEMMTTEDALIFHRMLPIETKTRSQALTLNKELEAERGKMTSSEEGKIEAHPQEGTQELPIIEAWGDGDGSHAGVAQEGPGRKVEEGEQETEREVKTVKDTSPPSPSPRLVQESASEDTHGEEIDNGDIGNKEGNVQEGEGRHHDEELEGEEQFPNWVRGPPLPHVSPFLKRHVSPNVLTGSAERADSPDLAQASTDGIIDKGSASESMLREKEKGKFKGPLKRLSSYLNEGPYWAGRGRRDRKGK